MIKSMIKPIGTETQLTTLENKNHMRIIFCNKGAAIFRIFFSDKNGQLENILMAPESVNVWTENRTFSGSIVGPLAGRYDTFETNPELELNRPPLHFHGGTSGLDTVCWEQHLEKNEDSLILTYQYFDKKTMTYFEVAYTFSDQNRLTMEITATTEKVALVNPTNHLYFNLNGNPFEPITNHQLKLDSKRFYLEDSNQLITSQRSIISGEDQDFYKEKSLDFIDEIGGLNTTFGFEELRKGSLYNPDNGRKVTITTTLPAVVIYTFNFPQEAFAKGSNEYPKYAGITFETQYPANDLGITQISKEHGYYSRTDYDFTIE